MNDRAPRAHLMRPPEEGKFDFVITELCFAISVLKVKPSLPVEIRPQHVLRLWTVYDGVFFAVHEKGKKRAKCGPCKGVSTATSSLPVHALISSPWTRRRSRKRRRASNHAECHPHDAEIPFDWALAEVTGKHGKCDFVLTETARCPNCRKP